ncbi:MAG: ParB/RepB/Spo0J family partition protein [Clostridia bacterium]|nr:ParB/RepB/Spo0J family partition protein [Clostridia bacterium]
MKKKAKMVFLPVGELLPNPRQPRSTFDDGSLCELAESIRRFGILQPIIVRKREKVPKVNINNQVVSAPAYEIIAGERRWRAARITGMDSVPCIISEDAAQNGAYIAFCENVFREDLSCFDIASALQDMLAAGGQTQAQLAASLGMSQSAVANKLRLLKLTPEEREYITANKLTEKHARAFVRVEDGAKRAEFMRRASALGWSAQETDKKITSYLTPQPPAPREEQKGFRGRRIGAISDIGMLINSINNAVRIVRDVGVDVERRDVDTGDMIEITIKVPKNSRAKAPHGE